jgi:hypothetical protein
MMQMTKETVLAELQRTVPHFRVNPEWLEDGLAYPAINDFARFICSEADTFGWDEVEASMIFLERALLEGDGYVRDLVLECVETINSCESIELLKNRFGAGVHALWEHHFANRK